MLTKLKKFWKEDLFFGLKTFHKENKITVLLSIVWLIYMSLLYSKLGFIILAGFFFSLFLDREKSNTKFVSIFDWTSVGLFFFYMIYLLIILIKLNQ